jgi:hypothetical protein
VGKKYHARSPLKQNNSVVRFEYSSTESTHDSSPRFPVKWHIAKSCTSFHISYTCSTTTPWTNSGCRLASSHLPGLINKKTKANHGVLVLLFLRFSVFWFSDLEGDVVWQAQKYQIDKCIYICTSGVKDRATSLVFDC